MLSRGDSMSKYVKGALTLASPAYRVHPFAIKQQQPMSIAGKSNGKRLGRHRWPLFQGILPLDRTQILPNLMAGLTLAALIIPQGDDTGGH